jgi:tRNA threonylcarbamoyladenosine biosynthesis protein TsaB
MNVLAFDTCFDACSVAVERGRPDGARALWAEYQPMTIGHAEALLPMIGRVMGEADLAFSDVERIAVTIGPGTFTGTRIGVSAARALALALGVPVVGFSSLWAVGAAAASRIPDCTREMDAVLVARDARRDEIYAEVVAIDGRSLTGPCLVPVDVAAALAPGHRLFAVGSGAVAVVDAASKLGREIIGVRGGSERPVMLEPDAGFFVGWGKRVPPMAGPPRPLYLRPPDARPPQAPPVTRRAAPVVSEP